MPRDPPSVNWRTDGKTKKDRAAQLAAKVGALHLAKVAQNPEWGRGHPEARLASGNGSHTEHEHPVNEPIPAKLLTQS
ncbi:hypothetical protein [Streptomyces sp. NPDC004629]|uniref:hypothetical protein n=1 Tax=Streptomyces sp. NPDC004629 TaxID=3364705 RepID=UPI0036863E7F